MLERGLLSRILFPAPPPSYGIDSFPHDLIWVPKARRWKSDLENSYDTWDQDGGGSGGDFAPGVPPVEKDNVPCLMMPYPSARFLILFFHSNAEDLGRCRAFCNYIREQFQVHVLAVEYPGYGICPGIASGAAVMENALAALHFATDILRWPIDSIKVFGRSIGTGPASLLASRFSFAGVILVTPFLSIQDLFRDRVGPFANFVDEWFDNKACVTGFTSPTMIIHGQRDVLIPCRHGERLYALCRAKKLLISPPEMEHNTNLLTNLRFFVLPMFQFFALPDYAFQELTVPAWAFDKRRSPFYMRPVAEVTHSACPLQATSPRGRSGSLQVPVGDDEGALRPTWSWERHQGKNPRAMFAVGDTTPLVDFEQFAVETQPTVHESLPSAATKGRYRFARADDPREVPNQTTNIDSEVMHKLVALASEIVSEVCSDGLCTEVPTREGTKQEDDDAMATLPPATRTELPGFLNGTLPSDEKALAPNLFGTATLANREPSSFAAAISAAHANVAAEKYSSNWSSKGWNRVGIESTDAKEPPPRLTVTKGRYCFAAGARVPAAEAVLEQTLQDFGKPPKELPMWVPPPPPEDAGDVELKASAAPGASYERAPRVRLPRTSLGACPRKLVADEELSVTGVVPNLFNRVEVVNALVQADRRNMIEEIEEEEIPQRTDWGNSSPTSPWQWCRPCGSPILSMKGPIVPSEKPLPAPLPWPSARHPSL